MTQNRSIFFTGCTGFIGQELLASLLIRHPTARFYLLIRGRTQHTSNQRFVHLVQTLKTKVNALAPDFENRLELVSGDVSLPQFGLEKTAYTKLTQTIDTIFHSAAHVILEAPYEESKRLNYDGTIHCLQLAQAATDLGHFKRFNHISTAFVAGKRKGVILETDLDRGQGFNNNYERVKFEAERELRKAMPLVPITIFRPSMVMGHSKTGWTNSFNVLYGPIKFSYLGLLPRVPGNQRALIDTVPIDFVVDALSFLSSCSDDQVRGKTFHLTSGADKSITVPTLIEETFSHFQHYVKAFNLENPLLKPKMIPPWIFRLAILVQHVFAKPRTRKYLENLLIYADYTSYEKTFDHTQAQTLLASAGISPPALKDYLDHLVRYCVQTHFGKSDRPRNVYRRGQKKSADNNIVKGSEKAD